MECPFSVTPRADDLGGGQARGLHGRHDGGLRTREGHLISENGEVVVENQDLHYPQLIHLWISSILSLVPVVLFLRNRSPY